MALGGGSFSQTREFIRIRYMGFTRRPVDRLLEHFRAMMAREGEKVIEVYTLGVYGASRQGVLTSVPSPVLAEGVLESLVNDIETFLDRQAWYDQRGVPYRRGFLLSGPAGTGKTSVVRHLAKHFQMPIYCSASASDAFTSVPPRSILLLEDIDCFLAKRPTDEDGDEIPGAKLPPVDVTNAMRNVGQMLNALDGITPLSGVIVIMTTNHPDRLDHALVRPGRMDRHVQLGLATAEQAERHVRRFFPALPAGELAPFGGSCSSAQRQEWCVESTAWPEVVDKARAAVRH